MRNADAINATEAQYEGVRRLDFEEHDLDFYTASSGDPFADLISPFPSPTYLMTTDCE